MASLSIIHAHSYIHVCYVHTHFIIVLVHVLVCIVGLTAVIAIQYMYCMSTGHIKHFQIFCTTIRVSLFTERQDSTCM